VSDRATIGELLKDMRQARRYAETADTDEASARSTSADSQADLLEAIASWILQQ
jgi:hypothetical protein